MQVSGPGIVAKTCPEFDNLLNGGGGQGQNIWKTIKETQVIRNHRSDLSLLQHDFRKPDSVRVSGLLPGQTMTSGMLLPDD